MSSLGEYVQVHGPIGPIRVSPLPSTLAMEVIAVITGRLQTGWGKGPKGWLLPNEYVQLLALDVIKGKESRILISSTSNIFEIYRNRAVSEHFQLHCQTSKLFEHQYARFDRPKDAGLLNDARHYLEYEELPPGTPPRPMGTEASPMGPKRGDCDAAGAAVPGMQTV